MIMTILLYIIYYAVYAILSITILLLPDVSANTNVTQAITTAIGYLNAWQTFLPLTTIFSVLTAIIVIEGFVALYKLIMWVIRRFPTQS